MYLFCTNIASTIALIVAGWMLNWVAENAGEDDDALYQKRVGQIIVLNTGVPCLIASFCFFMSSSHYAEYKRKSQPQRNEESEKTEEVKKEFEIEKDEEIDIEPEDD